MHRHMAGFCAEEAKFSSEHADLLIASVVKGRAIVTDLRPI